MFEESTQSEKLYLIIEIFLKTNMKLNSTVQSICLPRKSSPFCFMEMEREKNSTCTDFLWRKEKN